MSSILDDVKTFVTDEWNDAFDKELIMDTNLALMTLNQLGVGPKDGFVITDNSATWNDFFGDRTDLGAIQSYVGLKVKLLFDPPSSSFVLDAMKQQLNEAEWRINVQVDRGESNGY